MSTAEKVGDKQGRDAATSANASMDGPAAVEAESRRVAESRERAHERLTRQRELLRPLGWAMIAAVAIGTINGSPAPASSGRGLGVGLALATFVVVLAVAISEPFTWRPAVLQAAALLVMGGAGVALASLQPQGATELAGGAAVFTSVARLPFRSGVAVAATQTVGLAAAVAVADRSASVVVAATLLCALLAFVARFMRLARENQDRTELLLAQLEDAREEQTRAAAVAERGRIAGELHDVLAQSLSGAAIQLQATRVLAEREGAGPEMRSAIERASELVRDGLARARQAVGALRGDSMPGVRQLPALVDSYRDDMHIDVTLCVEGQARALSAEASLALYRAVQEALTNVARYARGAQTSVVLRYGEERTSVIVENGPAPDDEGGGEADLRGVGGGRGLAGLRERLERVDGALVAGAADGGWRVVAEIRA